MVEFLNISLSFKNKKVFDSYSLKIPDGKVTVIMGPSGCGKSTLLKIAAGILKPDAGEFKSIGRCAMMFQEPRLLPWKSARDNIYAVLRKQNQELGDKYLNAVGLSDSLQKLPSELSGGMKQRLSLARCLAYAEAENCPLVLLDEPFSALDVELKKEMIALLHKSTEGKTVIIVTHDAEEAGILSDNVVEL